MPPKLLAAKPTRGSAAPYWLCQIAGWGMYSVVGLLMAVSVIGWSRPLILGYLLFFGYSIGISHLYRREILRRRWLTIPALPLAGRLAASNLLLSVVMVALVVLFRWILGGGWTDNTTFASTLFSLYLALGVWCMLYVGISSKRRNLEMELALRQSELRSLEAQINPHFLFNCLNTLRGMILEDPVKAQDMVTRLANLLRYNLQREQVHTVPLSKEIEAVSDYLELESMRFEERLRVTIAIEDGARSFNVPVMLLQTLVENAVKHGISRLPQGGEVTVRASLADGSLQLAVENTGSLAGPPSNGTRMGLANARERLRLLYGDQAVLLLSEQPANHVAATVTIPRANAGTSH